MEKTEKSGKWFSTGHYMEDGKTPITVYAHSGSEERRYLLEWFKPAGDIAGREERTGKRPSKRRGDNERE